MADSVGIDLVEIARIGNSLDRYGDRFTRRILGPEERAVFEKRRDKAIFLSGRFAAKEAIIKALGRYLKVRPLLRDIQILNDKTGQPVLRFPSALTEQLAGVDFQLSISHDRNYAVAMVVTTEKK